MSARILRSPKAIAAFSGAAGGGRVPCRGPAGRGIKRKGDGTVDDHGAEQDSGVRRSERLLLAQTTALEQAIGGAGLDEALERLVQAGAERFGGHAAIVLMSDDGRTLRFGVAAGLPESYRRAVDGTAIGPLDFPCALAAHSGERVVIANVAQDPRWASGQAALLDHGIAACWSTPIRTATGTVLGAFTIYHAAPCAPGPQDLDAVDRLTRTAALLIERDRTERERQSSEAMLSSVLEHLPVGVAVYDTQGRTTRNNRLMRDYTNGSLPSADDREASRWRAFHPDGRPVERKDFSGARALRGEIVVPGMDFLHRAADGTEHWTRVSAAPLRDGAGQITGVVAVVSDIDAEKRAAQGLAAALDEARRSELVAHEMSHRIMNSFQLLHGLVSMQTATVTDPAARKAVEQAFSRIQAMALVQRRLFEATRNDLATLDAADYLQRLGESLTGAFIDSSRCTLVIDAAHGIPMPAAQASSMGLIVTELVLNALKHAFGAQHRGTVMVRFEACGDDRRLTVTDDGTGLPDGAGTAKPAGSGQGMGMTLVHGLVRQLGGRLDIDRPDQGGRPGTRFVLTFPA